MVEFYTHLNSEDLLLLEMAEVGRFDRYKISIYGGEGPVPHFHFDCEADNIHGCIRLDKPEYFQHGRYKDKLAASERKRMIKWLISPHKSFGKYGATNWDVICIYWNDNNQDHLTRPDLPIPDYNTLR